MSTPENVAEKIIRLTKSTTKGVVSIFQPERQTRTRITVNLEGKEPIAKIPGGMGTTAYILATDGHSGVCPYADAQFIAECFNNRERLARAVRFLEAAENPSDERLEAMDRGGTLRPYNSAHERARNMLDAFLSTIP